MQDQNAFEKSKEYAGQWIIFYNAYYAYGKFTT